ncbi:MAG: replicative DNA helicase [Geminicoccaceae bacterium]
METFEPRTDSAPQDGAIAAFRTPPHNLDAEMALLGAIMTNNEAYHRVADFLRAEHFYLPVHQRIFEHCTRLIGRAQLADPVTLRLLFEQDADLRAHDGAAYLSRLAIAAESIVNADAYGREILDLSMRRDLIGIGEDSVNRAYDPATSDSAQEQIEATEKALFDLAQEGESRGEFRNFVDVLHSAVDMIEGAFKLDEAITGVPTGLRDLDEKLGGLQPSDLLILAGRPSMGKTALALTIAANAAAHPARGPAAKHCKGENFAVGVFSLEMSAEQLAMRLIAAKTGFSSDDLRKGKLRDQDFTKVVQACTELGASPLYIDDTPALSIAAVRTRARRMMRQHGLALIVVDYLQLLSGSGRNSQQNRVQEISEITQGLKAIAKELDVPVMALSQLSRAVEQREDKRPQLADLRESGSIEQDADVVMFVYRDEYYQERAEPKQRAEESVERFRERYEGWSKRFEESRNRADVIIAKQRNGPIGNVRLAFYGELGRFADAEYRDVEPY